ncbi:MAG: hypothetical protein WAJ99_13765 [Candidatus Sulfotelmatobacter sp.]
MKFKFLIPFILCVAMRLCAQAASPPIYAESFRQGSTRIIEERFEVKLTPKDSVYHERIKDSHGADRFVFSIVPHGPEGDTEITSWQVKLADLHHAIYDNVLLTTQQPSANPKDALWRLDPSRFAAVPLTVKRVIKVENFYVVLQVKASHFTPLDSPYLDSMTLAVELTNSDPKAAEVIQK